METGIDKSAVETETSLDQFQQLQELADQFDVVCAAADNNLQSVQQQLDQTLLPKQTDKVKSELEVCSSLLASVLGSIVCCNSIIA